MRRKSSRNASSSTPESKTDTRKSSRNSRRKRSPSKSQDSEDESTNTTSCSVNDNVEETVEDDPKGVSSKSSELMVEKSVTKEQLENEYTPEINNDTNPMEESHTPPPIGSTGNEVAESDEVDAEKGKSKGINNSQVEENSEIKMNSVISGTAEGATTNNDDNPEVKVSHSESSNNLTIQDQQSTGDYSKSEQPNVQTEIDEGKNVEPVNCETDSNLISEVKPAECSSASDIESKQVENVEVLKTNGENQIEHSNDAEADDDQAEEGEIRESKSDEESENYGNSGKVKKPAVRIKLRRDSLLEAIEQLREADMPQARRIKWNPEEHRCLKLAYTDLYKVHLEDFRSLSSELKLADEKDIKLEDTYKNKVAEPRTVKERTISMEASSEEVERPEYIKQSSIVSSDDQENSNIIALNRKISIVDDGASKLRPPPSPAKQPESAILFISNLVRPFTIKQLKELLERTGTIKDDGFWTDRIKSKCYVHYESTEEAESTRNALHGVNWPIGNGKKLMIEFATEEEMEKARNPPPAQPVALPVPMTPPPRAKTPQKENAEPVQQDPRNGDRRGERKRKDSDRDRERARVAPSREWDVGKETRRERSRSRSRERRRRHSGRRSITPLEDFIARKQRKLEESVPQKLMDDLFQRTKTMPCIYWQPLSPEEISIKQQQRLSRMEEHKRRLEENSRNRGAREPGRGAYRRRYD